MKLPINPYTVTSPYGTRNGKMHNGIDLKPKSKTALNHPICASEDARVICRGKASGYGNVLVIQLNDGTGLLYGHLHITGEHLSLSKGMSVQEGQIIARLGNTGVSSGPHLHFEHLPKGLVEAIKKNSTATRLGVSGLASRLDPKKYLLKAGNNLSSEVPSRVPPRWIPQVGLFRPDSKINLRKAASLSTFPSIDCPCIAELGPGDVVHYDAYCYHNGYVWIRQQRQDGSVGVMATGTEAHGKRLTYWGYFGAIKSSEEQQNNEAKRGITQVSKKGIELIKHFEGCFLKAYKCPADVWTIGYGHTKGVKSGQKITQAQAEQFLLDDLAEHMKIANTQIKIPLTQNQYDAIASFCFNLGAGIFTKHPELLTALNSQEWESFCEQLQGFRRGGGKVLPGLVRRRRAEADLFMKGLKPAASTSASSTEVSSHWISENGLFTLNTEINLRHASSSSTLPSTQNCPLIIKLEREDVVHYDAYCHHDGFVWIRQPRYDGSFGVMATGTEAHGKRLDSWGSFESVKTPTEQYYQDPKLDAELEFLEPEQILQFCNSQGIDGFREIAGDGNCFFRAVLAAIGGDENEHTVLRQRAINYMRDNPEQVQDFFTQEEGEETLEHYLERMSRDGEWVEDNIIQAVGLLLGYQIDIIEVVKNEGGEAETSTGRFTSVAVEGAEQVILLLRVNNNHYHVGKGIHVIDRTEVLDNFSSDILFKLTGSTESSSSSSMLEIHPQELQESLLKASYLYGIFKARYRDPATRELEDTLGKRQEVKDFYKRILKYELKPEIHLQVNKRLEKLKYPERLMK